MPNRFCRCVLLLPDRGHISCPELVSNDQPFCPRCENRHPEEAASGVRVTAWPLGQPHPLEIADRAGST